MARSLVAGPLLWVTACGDVTDGAPDLKRPVGDLRGAEAVSDGETIWVVGGTVVSDAVWDEVTTPSFDLPKASADAVEAGRNHLAIQYNLKGQVVQTADLGGLEHLRVFRSSRQRWSAASTAAGSVLAGVACVPVSGGVCELEDVVLAIVDGRATRLDIDVPAYASVRVLGAVGPEVYVAVGRVGGSSSFGEQAAVFAVEPARGSARRLMLPPNVWHARALCVLDDQLVALQIEADQAGARTILSIGFVAVSEEGRAEPTQIELPVGIPPELAVECTATRPVVLELGRTDTFPLPVAHLIDLERGTAAAPVVLLGDVVDGASTIGDDLLLAADATAAGDRPHRWNAGKLGPAGAYAGIREGTALVVGDRLFDVSDLLARVPGRDGPAPVEVEVASADQVRAS